MEKDCVLEVLNIKKIFSDGTIALDDVSFSIFRGEFTVLAGKNGSGKSVLMTLIAALEEPTDGKITLHNAKPGLVFQEAESQILGETPFEDVSFGAKNCGLKKNALSKKVAWSLEQTGLYHKKDANARMMSGGEKRRLAVSGILAMDKDLLIFDEPFANLDFDGVKSVCEILRQLKDDGKTVIVLTHELEKILALADRFIILNKGKILFNGSPSDGLTLNLEEFGIRNPLREYKMLGDLQWL
ncbi:MAG: ABC transporter ATP-binding protein [Treponema sp.]|nr:ABC transporter ATP-binding protein [Treponema sp.]